jgi:hypothetical protein
MDPKKRAELYIANEILPQLSLMARDGFFPSTFAYPFGRDLPETTELLKQHFAIVRGTTKNKKKNIDSAFLGSKGQRYVGALGLDTVYGITDSQFESALDRAMRNNEHLILYGHRIEPAPG